MAVLSDPLTLDCLSIVSPCALYYSEFLALVYQETGLRIDNLIPIAQTSTRPRTALCEIPAPVYHQRQ